MLFYAFGGRAPSAKIPNDLALYELALDLHVLPEQLRMLNKRNPRDFNKLVLVNRARKDAKIQIAINNKLESTYSVDV